MQELSNWKCRASAVGRLMTQKGKLGVGTKTFLQEEYDRIVYGIEPLIFSKYMKKGTYQEQDSLALKSRVDGVFYEKNEDSAENEYIKGTPDVILDDCIIDIKSSWDKSTFNKASLKKEYKYQLIVYCWLFHKPKAVLSYCLVNSHPDIIDKEKLSLYYKMDKPDTESPEYKAACQQLEMNLIFDFERYQVQHSWYDLETPPERQRTINEKIRVKDFEFKASSLDDIIENVELAREYLMDLWKKDIDISK